MAAVPESNGWPVTPPNRRWIPSINAVNIEPGDWIRCSHPMPLQYTTQFWLVGEVKRVQAPTGDGYVLVIFQPRPHLPAGYQPRRVTLQPLALVEVRLIFPAQVEQMPPRQLTA